MTNVSSTLLKQLLQIDHIITPLVKRVSEVTSSTEMWTRATL